MDEKQKRILKYNPYVVIKKDGNGDDVYWCTVCNYRIYADYRLIQTAKQAITAPRIGCIGYNHTRNLKLKSICYRLQLLGWKITWADKHEYDRHGRFKIIPLIYCPKGHSIKPGVILKLEEYRCPKC